MKRAFPLAVIGAILILLLLPQAVAAAPYFYITGHPTIHYGDTNIYSVFLYTDGSTLTAAQTVIQFDNTILTPVSYNTLGSRCNFWSPANPALGYGNASTPYFHQQNRFVLACGFSNPGFLSATSEGSLIAKFLVQSLVPQANTTTFSFANSELRYIGNTIIPGAAPSFSLTVYAASASATPTPVPPEAIAQDVLTLDQISFREVGTAGTAPLPLSQPQTTTDTDFTPLTIDNSIPPPPEFTPRPTTTPYIIPTVSPDTDSDLGSVLSIQSLRELFMPGKSNADQTLVLINLISLLTFLVVLTILIWRLLVITRLNKIKQRHMKEIIAGELSMIESKMAADSPSEKEQMASSLDELKDKLEKI
jgi:hypothetical protein